MRFKAVPAPPPAEIDDEADHLAVPALADPAFAVSALAAVRDALPIVPRSEADCCGRVVDRVDWVDERDVASEWIVFLRALELAERTDAGYTRIRGEIDRELVADRFRERILGAGAALDVLEDASEPLAPAAAFDAIRAEVPEWERRRTDRWRDEWLAHTERLLAWAALLGLAEKRGDGFVRA